MYLLSTELFCFLLLIKFDNNLQDSTKFAKELFYNKKGRL